MSKFIELMVLEKDGGDFQLQKISVENIYRIKELSKNFTEITLKEVVDGNNVVVKTTKTPDEIESMIMKD